MKQRYLFVLLIGSTLLWSACDNGSTQVSPPPEPTDAPYAAVEPQKYQAEVWQVRAGVTEKYFIATDGTKWRIDSAYGDPRQVTSLHTDKEYVVAMADKTYAEVPVVHGYETKREDMVREITYGMLNPEKPASYQKLKSEGGMVAYKVSPDPKEGSESIVTFDEKLGLPVKKEVYTGTAGNGTPTLTVSLTNFSTNVDASALEIPKDFKKVAIQDMKSVLTGKK